MTWTTAWRRLPLILLAVMPAIILVIPGCVEAPATRATPVEAPNAAAVTLRSALAPLVTAPAELPLEHELEPELELGHELGRRQSPSPLPLAAA